MPRSFQVRIFVLMLLWIPLLAAASEQGWLGMSVKATVEGDADPVLKTITITEIEPDSPAAGANIAVGDSIIEIDDLQVRGCKASQAKQLMTKAVGEKLTLRLQRMDGTIYVAILVAASKSAQLGQQIPAIAHTNERGFSSRAATGIRCEQAERFQRGA
jgi:predicted metalloprotease with PDZ domain